MKSKREISINFEKAKKDAAKLDAIAEKLHNAASGSLENSMKGLSSAWMGDNSRMFLKKETQIKCNMINTARDLRMIAADIRTVAKRIYDAEMRAYAIARRRKY